MSSHETLLAVLLSPLVGFAILPIKTRNRLIFYCAMALLPIANTVFLLCHGLKTDPIRFGWFVFSLDRFSFLFACLLNISWLVTIIYSSDFVRYHFQQKARTFYGMMSVALTLITGAGTSDNLFTLFLFYVLSIPAVLPLVTFREHDASKSAGRWYLYSTLGPALALALPILFYIGQWFVPFQDLSLSLVTGDHVVASFILAGLIVGLSKNCVAPFWAWLPKSSAAPEPVSGLIQSVGAVHVGTIAVLKLIVYLYGYEYMSFLSSQVLLAGWLIYLCGATALYTAFRAYLAQDLRKRFSYSTVGQISYVITAGLVGTPEAVLGALFHIASHSIAKMNLFFFVGTFNSVYASTDAREIGRIIPNVRWLAVPAAVSGLSIAGFPLLAGYYSKDLILLEEISTHQYGAASFLILGSIVNFMYILPILLAACRPGTAGYELRRIPAGFKIALSLNTLIVFALSLIAVQLVSTLK